MKSIQRLVGEINQINCSHHGKQYCCEVCLFNQPYLKEIELHGTVAVKGKWNRAKQEINGNRMFFNEQTTQDDVQLEPVYRIKEGKRETNSR